MKTMNKIPAEVKELRATAALKEPAEGRLPAGRLRPPLPGCLGRSAVNNRGLKEQGMPGLRLPDAITAF